MSNLYQCSECDNRTVLVNSGGVARTLICYDCNAEMEFEDHVETEWVGIEDEHDDYKIDTDDD